MANCHETTFGELQADERLKKLQRSLKLAVLRQEHSKSVHDGKATSVTTWPSISTINVDTLDSSCSVPSLQNSLMKSEVLASSNNLRNILFKKNNCNTNQQTMTTSSVKQYQQNDYVDRLIMPPPAKNTIYRTFREPPDIVRTSNCKKAASTSFNRIEQSSTVNSFTLKSAPSWISTNTNADKECLNFIAPLTTSSNNCQKVDRTFSKWRVMLNDKYELLIRGTLECGRTARSKPVIRRYSATCVESKYKHKYILQGNIVDERSVLPDYICGKFYNGFPDDWENVYQIWRTYISQGSSVVFRWPTPITDSDDDLKSEMTDLTYTCMKNNRTVPATRSCNLNECAKTENQNNTAEKEEKYHNYSAHSSQNYEKDTSFAKPFIPNEFKKNVMTVLQTKNIKLLHDEDNKCQNIKTNINTPSNSRNIKLKDVLQEDKLNIIINNLMDKNCSQKYIEKIVEMFDCLDFAISYRTESECNNDSVISASCETSKSEVVSLQQDLVCDDNANTAQLENNLTESKNYKHSTDLGYGSIRNDSNVIQLSNPINFNPEHDSDSDKSESETYAGIPKISIERVLKARETSRKPYKRKMGRRTIYSDASKNASNLSHKAAEVESVQVVNPDTKKNSLPEESCISITEDEVEPRSDTRECRRAINIPERPQATFFNHRKIQRNNFDGYGGGKSVTHVQNKPLFDATEAQKVNLNVFIKGQKIPYKNIQKNAHSQFIADVDYINSDSDVMTVSTSTRKTSRSAITPQPKIDQDNEICENNSDFNEKPCAAPKLYKEFIEQTKSEIPVKKSKPIIVSSVPVNLNLKISRPSSKTEQYDSKIIVKNGNKQNENIRPLEEIDKKSISKMSIATKSAINESDTKTTMDNKKEMCSVIDNKSDNINPTISTTNSTNEQSKSSKLGVEKNPKVLTAWMPKVVHYAKSKSELGLTFQGKLLNEAGYVIHRKFTTDIVARRLSATLIETVNHELYELSGHLNDKQTIPKELVRQCRYGCPTKIDQFCLTWKTLQHDNVREVARKEKLSDTTLDLLNAPVSSRGRRIIPPLSYWTGERTFLKDNNVVYSPGNSQELSLLSSMTDNSKEIQKDTNTKEKKQKINSETTPKKRNLNKQALLLESNKTSNTNKNQTIVIEKTQASKTSPKIKTANNERRSDNAKKSRKSINSKRQLVQKLTFSSTDSNEEEQEVSSRKRIYNSRTNENTNPETSTRYTLRKRQKIETSSNRALRNHTTRHVDYYSPKKKFENQDTAYAYYQNISQSESFLSENEASSM